MSRFLLGATWDDAPHLDDESKETLWASIPEYQRDARSKGIPQLGSGAIYPFPESSIRVDDFQIPKHYARAFGLDCALAGTTAAAWGALDRDTDILYITSVYRRAQAEVAVHASAIKARGQWIPGVGDAADIVDSDRTSFLSLYRQHGIDLVLPDKSVETGIQEVYDRMSTGRFKVFASCAAFFEEFRLYRRDEKGRVVKQNDHIMDAVRYLVRSGLKRIKTEPTKTEPPRRELPIYEVGWGRTSSSLSWMA